MKLEMIAIIISIVSMLITAVALWFTITSFKKQLQLQFFAEYTKRYQEILLNFPENINQKDFDFTSLEETEKNKTLRYMRAYIDLCSEEYFLWKRKNIGSETWKEWEQGIKFAFSKPAFQQAWSFLQMDTIYYSEFTEFVNNAIQEASNAQINKI